MVYCGKASLNCKNCRVRRIKCNRLEPECSQCVRAGKKCPGYRDQLALMFRDETVKLKRKFDTGPYPTAATSSAAVTDTAHTALSENTTQTSRAVIPDLSLSPSQTPEAWPRTPAATDKAVVCSSDDGSWSGASTSRSGSTSGALSPQEEESWRRHWHQRCHQRAVVAAAASALVPAPPRTPGDRGLQFYLDNYLYGHPESPGGLNASVAAVDVAADIPWISHPPARMLAEAVGMEGLANLTGDRQLRMEAWQGYVAGLRQTAEALAHASPHAVPGDVRSIVLLAMFELVRGTEPVDTANVHILGAAALMSKFFPLLPPSPQLFRGLMQMCFSLLIAYHSAGTPVPPAVSGFVTAMRIETEDEQLTARLLVALVDVVNLSAYLRRHVLVDARPDTAAAAAAAAGRLLLMEARLAAWEASVHDRPLWRVQTCHTTALPPEACYRGTFHRYHDIPTARIWGYYRWARILLNETLLVFLDQCPRAVARAVAAGEAAAGVRDNDAPVPPLARLRRHARQVIRACAEATLISTPTHWRHPGVGADAHAQVASPTALYPTDRPSSGAVSVFPILFHLHVAACAPGTPRAAWQWALDVVDTVWAQLGLEQARLLGSQMRAHRAALDRKGAPEAEKVEEVEEAEEAEEAEDLEWSQEKTRMAVPERPHPLALLYYPNG